MMCIYIYNGYAISSISPSCDPDQGAQRMADQPRPVRPRHLAAARALEIDGLPIWLVVTGTFVTMEFGLTFQKQLGMSSQLTNSNIFQRGRYTTNQLLKMVIFYELLDKK